ncbi:MAG: class I mannose-6-phosphate isomerase [Prevotella sp.]|nr:class I mannose-6-phosphate isomerase [Prevotella sp.]
MMMYRFEPLLKQTLWGGDKIIPFKHLNVSLDHVGESWELSGVSGSETIVADGPDKGKSLNQLVREQKDRLLGKENYDRFGDEFPLLVKFIDAQKDLSIQVHPNDEVAHRHGKPRGKTEMWYCLGDKETGRQGDRETSGQGDKKPFIYNGLKQKITPEQYTQMVEDGTITDALARYDIHEGDVFFIPAGRIHAIGAGSFVTEIQQTSDVTYRIYDYKRKDKNGNYRELHTKEAAESIDYMVLPNYRAGYEPKQNEGVELVQCPFFTTSVYDLTEPMTLDYSELDSFVILIAVKGEGKIVCDGEEQSFCMGDTLLLPATTQEVKVEGTVKFLETYV